MDSSWPMICGAEIHVGLDDDCVFRFMPGCQMFIFFFGDWSSSALACFYYKIFLPSYFWCNRFWPEFFSIHHNGHGIWSLTLALVQHFLNFLCLSSVTHKISGGLNWSGVWNKKGLCWDETILQSVPCHNILGKDDMYPIHFKGKHWCKTIIKGDRDWVKN